ncbi:hypothetical protein [Streptomyces globisporus]|uniref:hypothetical protein n=1 Tax=Streptomyces globisporus TaxID=1908 RepID=UPI00373AE6D4
MWQQQPGPQGRYPDVVGEGKRGCAGSGAGQHGGAADLLWEKGWKCQYSEGEAVLPVPRAEDVLSRPMDAECPSLRVWPTADVLAIFRFLDDQVVDFDVDLRELQGQERLDVLCGFLREIGRRLGKPVLMEAEGACGHPILGFDVEVDRVVLLLEP